eukprot:scaffold30710_cov61-Phaeocystis_antarctica.AAC.4
MRVSCADTCAPACWGVRTSLLRAVRTPEAQGSSLKDPMNIKLAARVSRPGSAVAVHRTSQRLVTAGEYAWLGLPLCAHAAPRGLRALAAAGRCRRHVRRAARALASDGDAARRGTALVRMEQLASIAPRLGGAAGLLGC